MTQYQIAIKDLTVGYKTTSAVRDVISNVSLLVNPNTVVAILGTNGSGKTTLLSTIAGILKPTSGDASIIPVQSNGGQSVPTIALLHQDYRETNYPWASVLENVSYPLRFRGLDLAHRLKQALPVLNELLPEINPGKRAYELSGGQQQLLAIARALVSVPDVLLGDEPLSAADSVRAMRAMQAIVRARDTRPFPMIWVSHDIDEALLLGDSIALLSRRTRGFISITKNPVERPRTPMDLAKPEMAKLKARILDFLLSDNSTNQ